MRNFSRDDRSGGRRDFGRRDFGRRDFGGRGSDRQMHKAVCSNCGKDCEVPFRPTGDRPVFCSDCFEKNQRGSDSRRFEDRNPRRSNFEDRSGGQSSNQEQFKMLNAKIDKILSLLNSSPLVKANEKPITEIFKAPDIQKDEMAEDIQTQSDQPITIPPKKKKAPKKAVLSPEE